MKKFEFAHVAEGIARQAGALLRGFYERGFAEGLNGTRICGEMTWALRGIPGSESHRYPARRHMFNRRWVQHPHERCLPRGNAHSPVVGVYQTCTKTYGLLRIFTERESR